MTADIINGLVFEMLVGGLVWFDVAAIRRDRCVRGRSVKVAAMFMLWSVWNLWWYPHLGQWVSFAGAVSITVANATWLWFAWRYRGA